VEFIERKKKPFSGRLELPTSRLLIVLEKAELREGSLEKAEDQGR